MKHPIRLAVVSTVLGVSTLTAGAVYADAPPSPGPSQSGSNATTGTSTDGEQPEGRPAGRSELDARGVLTTISSTSLTLRTDDGQQLTYGLTADTSYRGGPDRELQRSDLAVGDRVHVRGEKDGTGRVARSVEARPAHLDGTVTAVGSDTITLVDRDGFTRTVRTSGDTKYAEDGATASRSSVADGEHIRAQGRVASDGLSLEADRVEIGEPTPPAGGPGAAGPGKPGGPGAEKGAEKGTEKSAEKSAEPSEKGAGPGAGGPASRKPSTAPSTSEDSLGS